MLDPRALLVLVALLLLALAVAADDRAVRLLLTLAGLVPFALFFLLQGRSQGRLLASASTEDGLHAVDVLDGRVVMDVYLDLNIANRHSALAERVLGVDVELHRVRRRWWVTGGPVVGRRLLVAAAQEIVEALEQERPTDWELPAGGALLRRRLHASGEAHYSGGEFEYALRVLVRSTGRRRPYEVDVIW
jgi:hypothetical protein